MVCATPGFWFRKKGILSMALAPLGALYYRVGVLRRGLISPRSSVVPLVVVGNILAGGAGKTPVVQSLCEALRQAGINVHIIAKGYGGTLLGPAMVDPTHHSAAQVGDEALMLSSFGPTWIAKSRFLALQAAQAAGAQIVISDDGLQNPHLKADIGFLVMDGVVGIGNGALLPAGPLREPLNEALKRVHFVIQIGGSEQSNHYSHPTIYADFVLNDYPWLRDAKVFAFAGIGRPEKFFASLTTSGADVVGMHSYPDHYAYNEKDILSLIEKADQSEAILVTTAKDAIKIPHSCRAQVRIIEGHLEWRDHTAFKKLCERLINLASHPKNISLS